MILHFLHFCTHSSNFSVAFLFLLFPLCDLSAFNQLRVLQLLLFLYLTNLCLDAPIIPITLSAAACPGKSSPTRNLLQCLSCCQHIEHTSIEFILCGRTPA